MIRTMRIPILASMLLGLLALVLAACSRGGTEDETSPGLSAQSSIVEVIREVPVEVMVEKEVLGVAPAVLGAPGEPAGLNTDLATVQRQVISLASVSVEVEVVDGAVGEVRAIGESLGGFVEQMSLSGDTERRVASMTIRVPQDQFFTALERISALGEVQSQSVSSQDVTEQFIDLDARLKSSIREEQSLLSLLEKAEKVSEILTIERELSRVRSDIERLQGQLNFLERRVALATITVSLFEPRVDSGTPPSASLTVEVSDVTGSVEDVKALVETRDGAVDSVFVSVREDKESAVMSVRVFTLNFEESLTLIEDFGRVRTKELREGTTPGDGQTKANEEPNARIDVAFVEKAGTSNTGLIVAIAAPIGGVILAALLGVLYFVTYRAGQRRGSPA